jgi:YD repeat-containing protein
MRTVLCRLALALSLLAAFPLTADQHPSLANGFDENKVYQLNGIDSVNVFSGNLIVSVPIGPTYTVNGSLSYKLGLYYNGNCWRFRQNLLGMNAFPEPRMNAGLGWQLTLGELIAPEDPFEGSAVTDATIDPQHWIYRGPDGADHVIDAPNLDAVDSFGLNNEAPFLRLTRANGITRVGGNLSASTYIVELPDGTQHFFQSEGYDSNQQASYSAEKKLRYMLTRIQDRRGNFITIDYLDSTATAPAKWVIHEGNGTTVYPRQHTVTLGASPVDINQRDLSDIYGKVKRNVVTDVTLEDNGVSRAPYHFHINWRDIPRRSDDDTLYDGITQTWLREYITIGLLDSIDLPDGSKFQFKYSEKTGTGDESYRSRVSGHMTDLYLPTGGHIQYTIDRRNLPKPYPEEEKRFPGQLLGAISPNMPIAIVQRTAFDTKGDAVSVTRSVDKLSDYPFISPYQTSRPRQMGVLLETGSPAFNGTTWTMGTVLERTVHYFLVDEMADGVGFGLEFTKAENAVNPDDPSLKLGSETLSIEPCLDGSVLPGAFAVGYTPPHCGSRAVPILRRTYNKWSGGSNRVSTWTIPETRTVYDSCRKPSSACNSIAGLDFVDTTKSDYDGYGNYRTQTTTSTLETGTPAVVRTTTTNYHPGRNRGGNAITADEPWLLETYTYQETIEGAKKVHADTTFDATHGELLTVETYAGPAGEKQSNDPVVTYTYDSVGNRTGEAYAHGDTISSSCTAGAPTSYTITNQYQTGLLAKSQYSGASPSFFTVNREIDHVGLVTATTDSSGVKTAYAYDSAVRLTGITPSGVADGSVDHSAATRITYHNFVDAAHPAYAVVDQPSVTNGSEKYIYYDWLGRVVLVKTRLPGSSTRYSAVGTVYDALGRKTSVTMPTETSSNAYDASFASWPATAYTFDSLGRITQTTQPDEKFSTADYPTAATVTRSLAIGNGVTGTTTTQVTTETRDALDRLTAVDESVSGTKIHTEYAYTPADQLASVVMKATAADGTVQTQNRTFTYDGRGLLTQESMPEKQGAVKYTSYDSRGHLRQKDDNGTILNYDYDAAERLTKICNESHVLLAEYQYDSVAQFSPNPASLGKLVASTRHNRGTTTASDVPVTEFFRYGGRDGLISQKATCIDFSGTGCPPPDTAPNASQRLFSTSYTYDESGKRSTTTVAACTTCTPAVPARQWTSSYTNGLLTDIALTAPSSQSLATIGYSEAGLVSTVAHAGAGIDSIVPDSSHMPRPGQITFDKWVAETCTPQIDQTSLNDPQPIQLNGTATLTAVVLPGSGTVWYQWYDTTSGRVPVAGATSASLTTGAVTATRRYAVTVTNSCGSVASREVTVRLASCATVSVRSSQKAEALKPFTLTAEIDGDSISVASYQWYRGQAGETGNAVTGGTSSTLTITAPDVGRTDYYWVAITGTGNCPASTSGTVAVTGVTSCGAPVITALDAVDHRDGSFTLRLSMDCLGETYTWTRSELKADTIETTSVVTTAADDNYQRTVRPSAPGVYKVVVQNVGGTAERSIPVWPICRTFMITSDLSDQRVTHNSSAHLSIAMAASSIPLAFDWYEGRGGDLNSQYRGTTTVPEFDTPLLDHDTTFWVRIRAASYSDSYCKLDSRTAQITICNPAMIVTHPNPRNFTCLDNNRTVLGVVATGDGIRYKWYAGNTPGDMASSTPLSSYSEEPNIMTVYPTQTTSYWVRVTGECGVADSRAATVTVLKRPVVTMHVPEWQMSIEGEPVTVSAECDQPGANFTWAEIVWAKNGLDWVEETQNAYVGSPQVYNLPPGTHQMRLYVYPSDNRCPTINEFTIDVCHRPQFTVPLSDRYVSAGTFTDLVPTTDTPGATIYWYLSDPRIGAPPTMNMVNAIRVSPPVTTTYWYKAYAGCYSEVRSVTVYACTPTSVTITAPPTIVEGTTATISAVATDGVAPIGYIWYTGDDRGPVTEIGRSSASIPVSPLADTTYWVEAYGSCPLQSTPARQKVTIAVCHPARFTLKPPETKTLAAGEDLVLGAAATGTNVVVRWYKNAVDPSNEVTTLNMVASDATAGTYWVVAQGDCGTVAVSTSITVCHVPLITTQPANIQIMSGGTTTLSVTATGTTPLTYSWMRINTDATETQVGTASTYTTDALTAAMQYYVVVTSQGYCTMRSTTATVSVCRPSQFTATPADIYVNYGPVNLSVPVDDPNATETWYASDPRLGPATVVTPPVNPAAGTVTTYWVQARNGICVSDVTSQTVYVCTPVFTSVTPSQRITEGNSITLQAAATGPLMTYKWWTGTTAPTTEIAPGASISVSPTTDTNYWAEAKCNCPITTSPLRQQVTITVCHPARITSSSQPTQNVTVGDWVMMTATTTGTNVQVAWFKGAVGDTSAPVDPAKIANGGFYAAASDSGTYWLRATSDCGTATASTVVDVCVPPVITTQPVGTQVQSGNSATLTVAASATGTGSSLTYSWTRVNSDSTETVVGTAASFNTGALAASTTYYVRVWNKGRCYVDSSRVTVSVCTVPTITYVTPSQTIGYQQPVQLYVAASGSAMSYEWKNLSTNQVIATAYSVDVAPTATTSYTVRVYSGICSVTSATVTLTVCGPTITQQPAGTTIQYGSTATLSVAAVGDGAITAQWYRGNQGDTSAPVGTGLSVTVQPYVATTYWVRVSTTCRSVDSTAAVVNISGCTQPAIQSQSGNMTVVADQNATMSVTPTTTADMHYQWYIWDSTVSGWLQVAGAASSAYTEGPTTVSNTYMASIWNSCGLSANSNTIAITRTPVCYAASITTQPASVTYNAGQSVTFSVAAAGTNVRYQWYGADPTGGSFMALTGNTASTLTVTPQSQSASYYVVATANCGASAVSNTVTATRACTAPAASSQTQSQTIRRNAWVNLNFTATGTATISYTWYSSATGSNFTQAAAGSTYSVQPQVTTYYYAVASNACGSVTSNYITITVTQCAPTISTQPASQTISSTQNVTLNVAATSDQLQYQWYISTGGSYSPINGATSPTLTYAPTGTSYFYVFVSNDCGSVNSNTATVTVTPACVAPGVSLTGPSSGMFDVTRVATLTAYPTGSNSTLTYYCTLPNFTNPTVVAGPGTATQVTVTQPTSGYTYYYYYVVASNACGTATSGSVAIAVYNPDAMLMRSPSAQWAGTTTPDGVPTDLITAPPPATAERIESTADARQTAALNQ